MDVGQYKLKSQMIEKFNTTVFNYGDAIGEYIFEVIGKSQNDTQITYILNLYDNEFNFQDGIIQTLKPNEEEAFIEFFEALE